MENMDPLRDVGGATDKFYVLVTRVGQIAAQSTGLQGERNCVPASSMVFSIVQVRLVGLETRSNVICQPHWATLSCSHSLLAQGTKSRLHALPSRSIHCAEANPICCWRASLAIRMTDTQRH